MHREDNDFSTDSEEELISSFYSAHNTKKPPAAAPYEKVNIDSDNISTESSNTSSLKQFKGPHTVLKAPSSDKKFRFKKHGSKDMLTITEEEEDKIGLYKQLLQEAEESVSSRDVLISMLQEQLKKIENLYKQNLDESQDMRFKYCRTAQELANIRKICEKYREDINIFHKQRDEKEKEKVEALQKAIEEWKMQYNMLLSQTNIIQDKLKESVEKIPKEIQVDLENNPHLQTDVEVLKDQYLHIQNSILKQNEKLELLVQKLQDTPHTEVNDKLIQYEKLSKENQDLRKQLDDLHIKNEESTFLIKRQILINGDAIQQSLDCKQFEEFDDLKKELEHAQQEIKELSDRNAQLQQNFEEISFMKEKNSELNKQLEESKEFVFTSVPIDVKDSLVENLKKENAGLREEINSLKEMLKFPPDFKECHCDDTSEEQFQQNSGNSVDSQEDKSHIIIRGREGSRVSFAMGSDQLKSQFTQLHKRNSELNRIIERLKQSSIQSEDLEQFNVEIVNLNRQIKHRDEIINHMKEEADEVADRRNEIIKELNSQQEIMKKDYEEIIKNMRVSIERLQEIITQDEIVIKTLQVEINGLKKEKIARNDFDDYDKTKTEEVHDELTNKTAIILERDEQIHSLQEKIEELEKLDASTKDKMLLKKETLVKDDLQLKLQDFTKNIPQIQELQVKVSELNRQCNEADRENKKYSKELAGCQAKVKKLESEQLEATSVNEKLKEDNKSLISQIKDMTNTLQQYKDIAEFKTLENEKLRKKEEQLQQCLSSLNQNNNNIINEYNKDKEYTTEILSIISESHESLKKDYQNKVSTLHQENLDLLKAVQQREEELKELKDQISVLTKELQTIKFHHQKDFCSHERSLTEMKNLFKSKEDELLEIAKKFKKQQDYLQKLEEENNKLKKLLNDNKNSILVQEKYLTDTLQKCDTEAESDSLIIDLSKQIKDMHTFKLLEENYNNDKIKNCELNKVSTKLTKDLRAQKIILKHLIEDLTCKVKQLENDRNSNLSISKNSIDEILNSLQRINNIILQKLQTSEETIDKNSEEVEKYSFYYDDMKVSNTKVENSKINSSSNNYNTNRCKMISCKNKELLNRNNKVYSATDKEELELKRKYLIKKVTSIEEKLNVLKSGSTDQKHFLPPRYISASESDLTCIKAMNKDSARKKYLEESKTNVDNLFFKCHCYLNKITLINKKLNSGINDFNIEENSKGGNTNINSLKNSTSWRNSLEIIIQQMAKDLNEIKVDLKQKTETLSNTLNNKISERHVNTFPYSELQHQIKDLQEQLKTTSIMSKQIEELEHELQLQHFKLQELQEKTQSTINEHKTSGVGSFSIKDEGSIEKSKADKKVDNLKINEEKVLPKDCNPCCPPDSLKQHKQSQVKPIDLSRQDKDSSSIYAESSTSGNDFVIKHQALYPRDKSSVINSYKCVTGLPIEYQKSTDNSEKSLQVTESNKSPRDSQKKEKCKYDKKLNSLLQQTCENQAEDQNATVHKLIICSEKDNTSISQSPSPSTSSSYVYFKRKRL